MIRLFRRKKGPSCEEIGAVLQSYLDGEVDEATALKVASHLEGCAGCAPEALAYSRIKESLAAKSYAVDPKVLINLQTFGERVARGDIS